MKNEIIIKENEKEVKKLYPITLTKPAFYINIGGYNLFSLVKETFPEAKIILKPRENLIDFIEDKYKEKSQKQENKKSNIIEIDALTIPSFENIEKIKQGKETNKIKFPHEIIILNKKLCKENLNYKKKKYKKIKIKSKNLLNKNKEIVNEIYVGKEVIISENIVFDSSEGPIIIDDNTLIKPFSYIKGPVYIGKNCKINEHSSIKENCVILNNCKIGGEIEDTIINEYTNKQHYGYLGNSYIGSWVNIGAGTCNSDLKNTYGKIKVLDGKKNIIKTNEQFLGCIIGDFCKTAINTSIYTGKIIGVNSVLYGTIRENIGSFINYDSEIKNKQEFLLNKAIETQQRMFIRRNIKQQQKDIKLLKHVFNETKHERKT